jgi:SAM-dependent methyltransferase
MDPGARAEHWDHAYAAATASCRSWYQAEPSLSLRLIAATGFGPDARVIDVGGGTSCLVDRLLARGYAHIGVLDVSRAAIDEARVRLGADAGRVEWFGTDVTRFEPPHQWDIWHDRATFHFLTEPEDRAAYRRVLLDSLVPGGHAILATFAPSGPERCSGLPAVRYGAADLAAELGAGFTLVESVAEAHTTPAGKVQDFLYCRFVRRAG